MYLDHECHIDKILLARIIRTLIDGSVKQCDLKPKRLLLFFSEVFSKVRKEKTTSVIEHLMCAMNSFIKSIAVNSRTQICKLGENIFISVLYLWQNRPSPFLKKEMIEFIHTQIYVHHPSGAHRGDPGSFAIDWEAWMSLLRKLYEVIYEDLQQMGGRNRFTGGSREAVLSEEYVDLAADLCNQLFSNSSQILEVTQLQSTQEPERKKRRIESGWTAVREIIIATGQTTQIIPWYTRCSGMVQLVTRLLQKYPARFPEDEIILYLQCLSQLLAECKRNDVMLYVLKCAHAFIHNWEEFNFKPAVKEGCISLWKKIWASTLRLVSLHHAEEPGYHLLTEMLKQGIIQPGRDVWSLFLPNISLPIQSSVDFLLAYMERYPFPENYQSNIMESSDNQNGGQYLLRSQLLEWILPSRDGFGDGLQMKTAEILQPDSVARVLALLATKCPMSVISNKLSPLECHVTNLEQMYLYSSCDFPIFNVEGDVLAKIKQTDNMHIAILLKKIENRLKDEAIYLMEKPEPKVNDLEELMRASTMVCFKIYWILEYNIITEESLVQLDLVHIFKAMFKKLATYMSEIVSKEGPGSVMGTLLWMQKMLTLENSESRSRIVVSRLCRSCTPAKIIETLTNIVFDKITKQSSGGRGGGDSSKVTKETSRFGHYRKKRRIIEDFDDFDIGNDDPPARDQGDVEIDDEFGESQDMFQNILSPSNLSESQKLRLEAVRTLCLWCRFDRQEDKDMTDFSSDVDQSSIKKKLEQLLDEDHFDPNRPLDLQMLQVIVSILTSEGYSVSDNSLDNMMEALRKLQEDGNYSARVRQAIARCMMTFVQVCLCICTGMLVYRYVCVFEQFDPAIQLIDDGGDSQDEEKTTNDHEELVQTLSDSCFTVRIYAAQNVKNSKSKIYSLASDSQIPNDRKKQDDMFDKIYVTLNSVLNIQGKLSPERAQDERNTRVASVLTTLGNIICSSPVCEKKAVFALCRLIRESGIEIEQAQNVIKKVSKSLCYKDSTHFISTHLPYLLHQWLGLGYPIEEFPYQIMDYFLLIIPELIMKKDITVAKEMVTTMKGDWVTVVKQSVPIIIVHIIPLFAATTSKELSGDEHVRRRTSHASACYDLLTNEVTKDVVDKTIVSRLDEIVVNVLMCLNLDPEPNPPCYNMYMTRTTLDYLTRSFSGFHSEDTIGSICQNDEGTQASREKTQNSREKGYSVNITSMALELLKDICVTSIEVFPEEFQKYLCFLVSNLVTLATECPGDIEDETKRILHLIIMDNYKSLKEGY
ncbi:hypothetical protein KUTeg_006671 [Tegillarca granosa]|uniref:Uncharacterized protein n=1 Tax=Tegillarca granosa TaxID=220873 RepID=A0ABQ9FD07_TEGGR|nr:hypothetical protein KUTeg_006671 [Tegillarca granosa]